MFYSDFAMPLTFEQEKKYLELGINESLRSSSSTVKHIEESAIMQLPIDVVLRWLPALLYNPGITDKLIMIVSQFISMLTTS